MTASRTLSERWHCRRQRQAHGWCRCARQPTSARHGRRSSCGAAGAPSRGSGRPCVASRRAWACRRTARARRMATRGRGGCALLGRASPPPSMRSARRARRGPRERGRRRSRARRRRPPPLELSRRPTPRRRHRSRCVRGGGRRLRHLPLEIRHLPRLHSPLCPLPPRRRSLPPLIVRRQCGCSWRALAQGRRRGRRRRGRRRRWRRRRWRRRRRWSSRPIRRDRTRLRDAICSWSSRRRSPDYTDSSLSKASSSPRHRRSSPHLGSQDGLLQTGQQALVPIRQPEEEGRR